METMKMKNMKMQKNKGYLLLELSIWAFVLILVVYSISQFVLLTMRATKESPVNIITEINYFIQRDLMGKTNLLIDVEAQTITIDKNGERITYKSTESGFFRNNRRITEEKIEVTDFCIQLQNIRKCYYPFDMKWDHSRHIRDNPPDISENILPPSEDVLTISAGVAHFLVLKESGSIYSLGANTHGELGLGDLSDRHSLSFIANLNGRTIVDISSGNTHSLALTKEGQVYAWGDNRNGQLGIGNTISQPVPQRVDGLLGYNIVQVSGGNNFSLALTDTGQVFAWGQNNLGQLGLGFNQGQTLPILITAFNNIHIKQVFAINDHSFAIDTSYIVYAWGNGWGGKLGLGNSSSRNTPTPVTRLNNKGVIFIAGGENHVLSLTVSGEVYIWGRNDHGQLGLGHPTHRNVPQRLNIQGEKVTSIASGHNHSFFLTDTGRVYGWGSNSHGQLGDLDMVRRGEPRLLTELQHYNIIMAVGSRNSSMFLTDDGEIIVWGN